MCGGDEALFQVRRWRVAEQSHAAQRREANPNRGLCRIIADGTANSPIGISQSSASGAAGGSLRASARHNNVDI